MTRRSHPRNDPAPGETRYGSAERWWDHRVPIEEFDEASRKACQEADRVPQDSRSIGDIVRENAWKAAHTLFPATMRHLQNPLFPHYEEKPAPSQPDPYRQRTPASGPAPDDPLDDLWPL